MSAQLTATRPVPRPRPHRTIPEIERIQIPAIDPFLLAGARILPSCVTDSVQNHLIVNYREETPVICRVGDKIYHYDGVKISVSPVGDPARFLNHVDTSTAAVEAKETAIAAGFIPRGTSVEMAPRGTEFTKIKNISIFVLSSANGWFDACVFDAVTGTILCYNNKFYRDEMFHSGDKNIGSKNHHKIVINDVSSPRFFGVVGYNRKELRQFTDQFNLVKMTLTDGTEKWITCEWDFTPVNIGDARVAGIFSVDKNTDGTMKLKVHFESYSKRDYDFNTGSTCHSSKDFARRYLEANAAVPSRTSVATDIDTTHAAGINTTNVPEIEPPCLVTSGPIPEILKTVCQILELEVTGFHPGIFGGNPGVSNLAYPGGKLVSGDYPSVVYINNPDDIHQSILELAKSRRCVLILKVTGGMEKINDVTLYACCLMTPQSTLVIFDDTVDKFYHVSGPYHTKEVDDSINIQELIQYHLDNPAGFPLLTDGKIYTPSGVLTPDEMIERIHEFLDYIDQLQMCISPEKWKEVFKSMLVSIDSHKKEIRKRAKEIRFRVLGLKMKKQNKKTAALISQDLATLHDKLGPLDEQLKGIKDIARFILKYQYHPMSSKTFGSSKKLSGDVQAQLRNLSTKALKDRIQQMLADPARFSEEIEELLDSLEGEDGWMIIGDPQKSVLDGPTVAVCNEMAPGTGIHIVLPNLGSQILIPVPVHIKYVNLVDAYQKGHDIYLYLGLLSASKFVTGSQNPFDDEPLIKMVRWLMESHDNLAATLSASYTPDDDNTTTKVLKTLRYLVVAVWKGFRDGMFRPELARFGGIIPTGQVPSGRVPFKDYPLQEAVWYARAIQKSSTNPAEMRSFMVRVLGDLCKSIWAKYIQPIEHILKGEKQQALAADAAAYQDRSNLILRYQLYLFLKMLYPAMDFKKAANVLFGSQEIPEIDLTPDSRRGHFKSTRTLDRIAGYAKLDIPSDEFQMMIRIFVSRVTNILPEDKTKKDVIETLTKKGPKAFGNMRRILESSLESSDRFPFFSTGEFGDKITENFDKKGLLEAIRSSASAEGGAAATTGETAVAVPLTPHQELVAFGLTEELATKFPMINPVADIQEISPLLEEKTLGITGDQIPEITKLVFKHWDNPDAGVQEVLKMLNLW